MYDIEVDDEFVPGVTYRALGIVTIGGFNKHGQPYGWTIDGRGAAINITSDAVVLGDVLTLREDGSVLVRGILHVPWTKERRKAMGIAGHG